MIKVAYVVFREDIPLTAPRCDERNVVSLAAGKDLRYDSITWTLDIDDEHRYLTISAIDERGVTNTWIVPTHNVRVYRIQ